MMPRIILVISILSIRVIQHAAFGSGLFKEDKDALIALQEELKCHSSYFYQCFTVGKEWNLTTNPCTDWYGVGCKEIRGSDTVDDLSIPSIYFGNVDTVPSPVQRLYNISNLNLSGFKDNRNKSYSYSYIPDWIGSLTQMKVLSAKYNNLVSVPSSLGKLSNLRALHLGSNQIASLPDDLHSLTKIEYLDISYNKFHAEVPSAVSGMKRMRELNVSGNDLTVFPDWLSNLRNLNILDISSNSFSGSLPRELRKIKYVYISGSGFYSSDNCPVLYYGTCRKPSSKIYLTIGALVAIAITSLMLFCVVYFYGCYSSFCCWETNRDQMVISSHAVSSDTLAQSTLNEIGEEITWGSDEFVSVLFRGEVVAVGKEEIKESEKAMDNVVEKI